MDSLETELDRARELAVDDLADAIQSIGFECTRCGGCCTSEADDPHTATVFPEEVRTIQATDDYDWRDVARPMPYGLDTDEDGEMSGETFEWALQVDDCGDCRFYEETDGVGACTVHEDRPLVCQTYPFSVALGGTSQPMGEPVDEEGLVRAHECEGLGAEIDREDARSLAAALKRRAIEELEQAIAIRDGYEPVDPGGGVVVHDSEGAKQADGTPVGSDETSAGRR